MTTLKKKKIIKELKDRESRQFFYEEHIETALPIQIRELRKNRKLTQKELAKLAECDQSNISDWENPNYEYTPQISTLKRLANVFDVPLIVRFGSWGDLLEWNDKLSPEKVAPESFDEFVHKLEQEISLKEPKNNQEANEVSTTTKPRLGVNRGKLNQTPTNIQPELIGLGLTLVSSSPEPNATSAEKSTGSIFKSYEVTTKSKVA